VRLLASAADIDRQNELVNQCQVLLKRYDRETKGGLSFRWPTKAERQMLAFATDIDTNIQKLQNDVILRRVSGM
jgi:hypothetical protein